MKKFIEDLIDDIRYMDFDAQAKSTAAMVIASVAFGISLVGLVLLFKP